ncbi:hypothetical protein JFL57_07505 [Histophilus somni]|nr:hypothetical protein [Histophilus somni]MBB5151877.1 putative component of toxin-antitoxin plasmid stabilization module [Histophilus somni]QQF76667.1 hypothetical protein JFL52_07500 [Histophilus somni]QQF90572.1 hypothetical protein JFL57_07505 [Histophilus somni]
MGFLHYAKIEDIIYLLTNGGDKKTQQQDISDAQVILEKFKQLGDDENE